MIYFLLILTIIVLYFVIPEIVKDDIRYKREYVCISFLLIFIVCVLRKYTVGRDIPGYRRVYLLIYEELCENPSAFLSSLAGKYTIQYFEKGYMFLMYLCGVLGLSFQWFMVVCYIIMLIPISVFIHRYSDNVLLSIIVFICYMFFDFYLTALRQALSMSIFLIGLMQYLNDKRKLKYRLLLYYLFVGLAFLFHQGAVIAIFLPLLSVIKRPVFFLGICAPLYFILVVFGRLITRLSMLFSNGNDFSEGLVGYLGLNAVILIVFGLVITILNYLKERGIVSVQKGRSTLKEELEPVFINMMLFSIVLSVYLGWNNSARMAMYYSISIVISLPMLLKYFTRKTAQILSVGLVVFLVFYFMNTVYGGKTFDIYPYQFFWD